MKKEAKICITATDCGDGFGDVHLKMYGRREALLGLIRLQAESIAKRTGVSVPAVLTVIASMDTEVITTDVGAIREAMKRMGDDKGAT